MKWNDQGRLISKVEIILRSYDCRTKNYDSIGSVTIIGSVTNVS